MTTGQRDNDDIESGDRFRLSTDSYDNEQEPIPNLTVGDGNMSTASYRNGQHASSVSSETVANTREHTVVNRMTPMQYLWRQHVRSRTNNPTMQALLDRILVVFLFLASLVEQPLLYLMGQTQQTTKNNQPKSYKTPVVKGTEKTGLGIVAYTLSQGRNPKKHPILCFHSDSRSTDEFLELQPLLANTGRRVVAIDSPGHGWSENPRKSCTIDDIADAFLEIADSLLIQQFVCVGSSSMGTAIAASMAARYPMRVQGCVHVNLLYASKDAPRKSEAAFLSRDNELSFRDDGMHLLDLHNKHKFLDPDLNLRCIQSHLTEIINRRAREVDGVSMEDVMEFDLESACRKQRCPTLCVSGESSLASLDARGLGGTQRFHTACRMLPHCEVNSLTGPRSTFYLINQSPKEFMSICARFFEKHDL